MWKALKWFFIGWALLLILSDLQITTSLYKYEDNRVVVNFLAGRQISPGAPLSGMRGGWRPLVWSGRQTQAGRPAAVAARMTDAMQEAS